MQRLDRHDGRVARYKAVMSFVACPPAENFLSNDCAWGVASAQMRKLIALFDRLACVCMDDSTHACMRCIASNDRPSTHASASFFSPRTRRVLTIGSRQKSDAPACGHPSTRWRWCVPGACGVFRSVAERGDGDRDLACRHRSRTRQRGSSLATAIDTGAPAQPGVQKNGRSRSGHPRLRCARRDQCASSSSSSA